MGRPEYGGNPYEGQAAQNQAAIKKTGRKTGAGRRHTKIPETAAYLADRKSGVI